MSYLLTTPKLTIVGMSWCRHSQTLAQEVAARNDVDVVWCDDKNPNDPNGLCQQTDAFPTTYCYTDQNNNNLSQCAVGYDPNTWSQSFG